MDPKTLSASAALLFQSCEARYKAEYIDRTPDLPGSAGSLGSAVHAALEFWIKTSQHTQPWPDIIAKEKAMLVVWNSVYYDYFEDDSRFAEGWQMLMAWAHRTHFDEDRTVLELEIKRNFQLPTSRGNLQVNYIFDRKDRVTHNGEVEIEVVDYKTVARPITADRMKEMIQPRLYALAAAIEHKAEAPKRIWVTYDLLRYSPVSVSFTRDENLITWKFLQGLAERIFASDGSKETLNNECNFCVRKNECKTLNNHVAGGGVLGLSTLEQVVDRLADVSFAAKALRKLEEELQDLGMTLAEQAGEIEFETENNTAKITASSRRTADSTLVAKVVGDEMMARYGSVGIKQVETMLKEEPLTDNQKSQLRQLIKKNYGTPRIEVKAKSPFEEE